MKIESLKPQWLSNIDTDVLCAVLFLLALPIGIIFWLYVKWNTFGFLTQIYVAGVVSYWLRWILKVIANCFRLLSTYDRNMAQIGMRRNIFLGDMQNKGNMSYFTNLMMGLFGFFVASLLSWFVYLLDVYRFIKQRFVRWQRPKAIKEMEWVLRNHLLSPLDVVRFDVKMAEVLLGRSLTKEECDSRQEQLDAEGIDIKMTDVLAINNRETEKSAAHLPTFSRA